MDPSLDIEKKPEELKPRALSTQEEAMVPASFPSPRAAGNQALQSIFRSANTNASTAPETAPPQLDSAASSKLVQLDAEVLADFYTVKNLLDSTFYTTSVEEKVVNILWRWAQEPFHTRPPKSPEDESKSEYLDRLLLKLRTSTKDIGIFTDQLTSYYDLMFNHFDRAQEIRFLRDNYSRLFKGHEPIAETKFFGMAKTDFFGSLWEDLKSGAIADRIGYYFLGMLEAGKGLLEGVWLLLNDPMKVLEGIGNLPKTARALWKNKGKIWDAFVSAPPNEQARMIGRILGEAEIVIYTVGAGGAKAATSAPQLATAEAIVPMVGRGGSAAAALGRGGAITIDLGKLGGEAVRLSSLMAMTAEGATKGHEKAKDLAAEEKPAPKSEGPVFSRSLCERSAGGCLTANRLLSIPRQQIAKPKPSARITRRCWRRRRRGRPWLPASIFPLLKDVVLLAMAPEIDLKYEGICAYLNNDVTRKWPTRDLALRLFGDGSGHFEAWRLLDDAAPLFASSLLTPIAQSERPSSLAQGFVPARALVRHLIAGPGAALTAPFERLEPLTSWDELRTSEDVRLRLRQAAVTLTCPGIFRGKRGSGRTTAARLMASALQKPLIALHATALRLAPETADATASGIALTAKLEGAAILVREAGELFRPRARRSGMRGTTGCPYRPARNTGEWPPAAACHRHRWREAARERALAVDARTLDDLAERFNFNSGQIRAVAHKARDLPLGSVRESLFAAARAESAERLGKLAAKAATPFDWHDLVLPPATLRSIREIASAIANRHQVALEWGMRRGALPMNLNVLFSGPSGTGKTMTAGVVARHLGLELYRCDLSGVVSKYIGETEKNLDRVFAAAQESNAILLFDEADALFGKRSQVKDAHDRYANIEVSYLLQKMEQHDGAVILVTNLAQNLDEAFLRRLQYAIEFPAPAESHREQLWRLVLPSSAPLAEDVDFRFLARQFALTGGQIRNIAVDAAFLAAADGKRITMRLLIRAVGRHLVKAGRLPSVNEFKEYFPLLNDEFHDGRPGF